MRLALILFCLWANVNGCPEQCSCNGTTVNCSGKGLTSWPSRIPDTTKTLNLRFNFLSKLLARNLVDLPLLETLLLGDNRITSIEENAFDSLTNLRRVSLARNRIERLPPLASGESHIVSIDVRRNTIVSVDSQAFSSFRNLLQLDLSANLLQSLPSSVFKNNKRLYILRLHSNPWNCDCRIDTVVQAIKNANYTKQSPKCFHPQTERGRSLLFNNSQIEDCQKPEIERKEFNFKMVCPLNIKKRIRMVWLYNGMELDRSSAATYQIGENGTLSVPVTQDPENFTCAADYRSIPHRTSRQVPVNSPPQFTYTTKDASFREGSAVKLHCETIGFPKPTISWFFKGKKLIPIRKYEFSYSNSVIKIYPFLEEDVGSYECEAVNPSGRIRTSMKLELISSIPPRITDSPYDQTVDIGAQVTFRCKAKGLPRPDITWFFDGSIIPHIRGRIMVSDDGTELTIKKVGRHDDGTFSCMAGNSVGAMSAEARLKVNSDVVIDRLIDDEVIQNIAAQAKINVDKAVENTRKVLSQEAVTNVEDLKRLFRFSIPAQAVTLSKAREIYEESIRLVHEHVQKGMKLPVSKLAPNVSYEAVLSVSHIQTLMGLSGCFSGQILKDSCSDTCFHSKYRSFDGQCNNIEHPMWGVASMPLQRLLPPVYENGFNTPVGWERGRLYNGYPKPNPREVSRQLVATRNISPHADLSSMVMQWGQFLDHDVTQTAMSLSRRSYASGAICNRTCENLDPCFNIPLAQNDPKLHTGIYVKYPCIEFERSGAVCGSGETSLIFQRVTYRDQMNIITSFIDGSVVYGSSEAQALELRDLFGDHGQLRFDVVSSAKKPYLPFEKDSDMDCKRNFSRENPIRCFLAGDLRANEQLGLASMHTIFLREHNRIAAQLLQLNINWDGETIYQETRKIVGAIIQHITYTEWLPVILGKRTFERLIGEYKGYNPTLNPSVTNAFATAAFRFGHTLINPTLFRYDSNFRVIKEGHLPLHKAFFAPETLFSGGGVDPLIRGLFASPLKRPQSSQLLNMELTEKLFNSFHEVALDLAVMNIQRGRDHGLPSYTEYRSFCNLSVPRDWNEMANIVRDANVRNKLKGLYGDPANIDLWVGGIVEDQIPDALMGPTFACIIADQFNRLRDGDRFWYENRGVFSPLQLNEIKKTSLARIFCDNGDDITRVQRNVFLYQPLHSNFYEKCENHPRMNLAMWASNTSSECSVNNSNTSRFSRKRRSEKSCHVNEKVMKSGSSWKPPEDGCTTCKCDNGSVWCRVDEHCS